jgi:hypothetical protein
MDRRPTRQVLDMMESVADSPNIDDRAIQELSEKLRVPELLVVEVYKTEFKRLAAQSRIQTYVSVLAMSNTRSILRDAAADG